MKVLLVHNRYLQRGGEDAVVDDETRLLTDHGHEVRTLVRDNRDISRQAAWRSAAEAVWSPVSQGLLGAEMDGWQPDVVHVHNTFPLISPAVLWTARRRGAAVVATLHNFRLACLEGTFLLDGQACQACLGKPPWRGIAYGCYRGSRAQSAVLAASLVTHRVLRSWQRNVHRFIVLNATSVSAYATAGIPEERIRVKPNFAWPVAPSSDSRARKGGLFVGRLSAEKGIQVLADALKLCPDANVQVVGSGPLEHLLHDCSCHLKGPLPPQDVRSLMQQAAFLIIPSVGYEQFPRVLAEAYASGLPVIAPSQGALGDLVEPGVTGLHFQPGHPADLAEKMRWASLNPGSLAVMGVSAQARYQARFSPESVYQKLSSIYGEAIQLAKSERAL